VNPKQFASAVEKLVVGIENNKIRISWRSWMNHANDLFDFDRGIGFIGKQRKELNYLLLILYWIDRMAFFQRKAVNFFRLYFLIDFQKVFWKSIEESMKENNYNRKNIEIIN
jgi:hypothetical protein